MPPILKTSFQPIRGKRLRTADSRANSRPASNIRYQTNKPSLSEISRPKMPVAPASRTDRWSLKKASFMFVISPELNRAQLYKENTIFK